jgi:hypothetical protein
MEELKSAEKEKMTIEYVIRRMNNIDVGIINLNDNELALLASQHGAHMMVNNQLETLTDIVVAARSEMSRRQNKSAIQATEALARMAEAQNKSAKRLTCATFGLVVATIGLIAATIFH